MKTAALFFLFLLPGGALASPGSKDPAWLALLHFSGSRSSVKEGSSFFLSPEGYRDAGAEFQATQKYFDEHPEEAPCRYPARAIFLGRTKELPSSDSITEGGKSEICARWKKWREAIDAKGGELVFAAAYISSPSSMYGHTLLKFVRGGKSEGSDLLHYTLNYGAKTGSVAGLPYVWLGLTGGFDGNYATAPFYLKVREYNFVENRDFWIYPLKLSEAQLRLLVAHSWELREVDFPYFFLHRNCSYYLLELLEILRPGSHLTSHFPFWAVPLDTIRLLEKNDWLGVPRYRASRHRRLRAYREELKSGEAEIVERLAKGETAELSPGRETFLLDAAYELWRYRNEGSKDSKPEAENRLLLKRAQFPASDFQPDFSRERPPQQGHPSSRVGLALGADNHEHGFAELSYRGALHDLLADPQGYEDFSELSMGDIRARVEDGKVFLERADLLRLRSVAPFEHWIPRWAWSFRASVARAKEFECSDWQCLGAGIEGGWGAASRIGPLLGFALLEGGAEAGKPYDRHYRLGVGPTAGIFAPLWRGGRALLEGEWRWRLMGSELAKRGARLGLSQSLYRLWEARAEFEVVRAYREGMLQILTYF